MSNRSSAKNRSSRRAASKTRLEFRPRPDKNWLLRGTALAGGLIFAAPAALADDQCGSVGPAPYSIGCAVGASYTTDGIDYTIGGPNGTFDFTLNHNTISDSYSLGGEDSSAFDIYMPNGGNFTLLSGSLPDQSNTITATGVHGMWIETVSGNIDIKDVYLTVDANGTGANVNPYYPSGGRLVGMLLNSHGDDITLEQNSLVHVNSQDGYGIVADTSNGDNFETMAGGDISINTTYWNGTADDGAEITGAYVGILAKTKGDVTITNDFGHIGGGTGGTGIQVVGGGLGDTGVVKIDNHTYQSVMGGHGDDIEGKGMVDYENAGGLTVGLSGDGLHIRDINGGSDNNAVQVYNGAGDGFAGGIIAGYWDGVDIDNVYSKDVSIDNSAHTVTVDGVDVVHQGGLIFGQHGQGVDVGSTAGSVHINNSGTLFDTLTGTFGTGGLDAASEPILGADLVSITTELHGIGGPNVIPTGIIGKTAGISLNHIGDEEGSVDINNSDGFILGYAGTGVQISDVEGKYNAEGGFYEGVWLDNSKGLTLGLQFGPLGDGLNYRDIDGDVGTQNAGGLLLGVDDGAHIRDVWRGNVWFGNAGGIIAGLDNAIDVDGVKKYGSYGGGAYVDNGDFSGQSDNPFGLNYNPNWGTNGGLIIGGNTAISLRNVHQAGINNGDGGWILGNGSWNNPVISLKASRDVDHGGSHIQNYGVMSSYDIFEAIYPDFGQLLTDLSTFSVSTSTDTSDLEPYLKGIFQTDTILGDVHDLNNFVGSAGRNGTVESLSYYSDAASDMLVKSSGYHNGLTTIDNYNLMVGRVHLDGHDDDWNGNWIDNYGTWLTLGRNSLEGSSKDGITNYGLIQTALDSSEAEWTGFSHLNDFYNGLDPSMESEGYYGILSMMDDGAGDKTWTSANFHGNNVGDDATSFVGVDVSLAGDGTGGYSDFLRISGSADGTTGLIINQTDIVPDDVAPNFREPFIPVVSVNYAEGNSCYGVACQEGDTFYIAPQSEGYVNVNGIGAVQKGLFAWYLTEGDGIAPSPKDGGQYDPLNSDPGETFALVATSAPSTVQMAGLTTGAQNIFFSSTGVVADHVYGNHFPTTGSGGADLPMDGGSASASGGKDTGLWAKISGNWYDTSTSVQQSLGGPTTSIDTSFNQNTYNVLGGADFSPTGERGNGWRFGVYGGYTQSDLSFDNYGATADYKGGTVGAYAAYTQGGFYVDSEVAGNFLDMTYKNPVIADVSANANTIGVLANTGYRVDSGWGFYEPIASFSYANTNVDNISTGGGTVDFSNGQSVRAGAGGRIGTSFGTPGGTKTEVALTGKLWNEFESANKITVTDGFGNSEAYSDNISGLFGEVDASATIYNASRNWSTFLAGGAKFNADFTSWDAKAGIRTAF